MRVIVIQVGSAIKSHVSRVTPVFFSFFSIFLSDSNYYTYGNI